VASGVVVERAVERMRVRLERWVGSWERVVRREVRAGGKGSVGVVILRSGGDVVIRRRGWGVGGVLGYGWREVRSCLWASYVDMP